MKLLGCFTFWLSLWCSPSSWSCWDVFSAIVAHCQNDGNCKSSSHHANKRCSDVIILLLDTLGEFIALANCCGCKQASDAMACRMYDACGEALLRVLCTFACTFLCPMPHCLSSGWHGLREEQSTRSFCRKNSTPADFLPPCINGIFNAVTTNSIQLQCDADMYPSLFESRSKLFPKP